MDKYQFKIIAINITNKDSIGRRKLLANHYYYFYQGFDIIGNQRDAEFLEPSGSRIMVSESMIAPFDLYNEYIEGENTPRISISAIVGENGSGKSSIVEFLLRLVNNWGATTIGEHKANPSSEHLHFINGVFGELYYKIGERFFCLCIINRNVILYEYSISICEDNRIEYILETTPVYDNANYYSDLESPFKPRRNIDKLREYYKSFFYTFVSNYSLYAYNTLDFTQEYNSNDYERLLRPKKSRLFTPDQRSWLKGIFHKNDGYQTPVVLTPFREKGNININTENILSKERLISLMIRTNSKIENSFRVINEHLEAKSLTLKIKNILYDAKYLNKKEIFIRLSQKGYSKFEELTVKYWSKVIGVNISLFENECQFYKQAIGYLTYKTLKISSNYTQYNKFIEKHVGIQHKINETEYENLIERLSIDSSHITLKIRQVLTYLFHNIYYGKGEKEIKIDLNKIATNISEIKINESDSNIIKVNIQEKEKIWEIIDFVPPPIFETQIDLVEKNTKENVLFETLSSGEKQISYSIGAILYHLTNINSVKYDKNERRIEYKYLNIILEEIELYFHPDLQKNFIKFLLDGIKQINLPNINSLNICIVTHSPFILSDIPSTNIMFLNKEGEQHDTLVFKTFGANIHDMLKSSFFLSRGAMGEYATHFLNRIVIVLQILNTFKENQSNKIDLRNLFIKDDIGLVKCKLIIKDYIQGEILDIQTLRNKYNAQYLHKYIMLFDEPIIRNALLEEFDKYFDPIKISKEQEIERLKKRINELENIED